MEFQDYLDVFSESAAATLPAHKPYDCEIKLLPGKQPPKGGIYRISPAEADELKTQIDDMLKRDGSDDQHPLQEPELCSL